MIQFLDLPNVLLGREEDLKNWLKDCAKSHESRIKNLVYHFVDNEEITARNVRHLEHNYATDIITFGYAEGKKVSGEVFIGYETVFENADDRSIPKEDELCRVIAHGLLHLIGFDDHSEEEKVQMRDEEENCLILRPKILRSN
ncbi:rRNA maturation RNase YbeY [Owenweeksia hongkongensis]|uniref:rRNA maturation RNase YbeY n=1 Tax=Owenweeksia hongkongensis TaxID=253245 RepID=UPI003A8FB114